LSPPFYTALISSACSICFSVFHSGGCSSWVLSTRSAFPGTSTAFSTTSFTIRISRSPRLNRLFSILESITVGFSQVFYECIHMQHHKGNADRPDEHGETIDWISIYKHGHDGEAEHPLKYTLFSFFREDPKTVCKELKRKNPREAFWGIFELTSFVATFVILGILNWHHICFLLPFWCFGHCPSYLNGYYRHYGGNPDEPIAWGVSTYGKLYNWTWFYNGYHAEHHFRPKVHWNRMQVFMTRLPSSNVRPECAQSNPHMPSAFLTVTCHLLLDHDSTTKSSSNRLPAFLIIPALLAKNEFARCLNTT
jgi:Fatty acid desaturase